jgi:hypothetical protein
VRYPETRLRTVADPRGCATHAAGGVEVGLKVASMLVGDLEKAGAGFNPPALLKTSCPPFEHGGDHAVWCCGVGEIGLDRGDEGGGFGVDRIAVDTDDDGSFFSEQAGTGSPNARGGTGDDHDLVGQL